MAQTHNGSFSQDLIKAAQENPVSAALIGMGLMWWFTGGSGVSLRTPTAVGQGISSASAKIAEAGQSVAEQTTQGATAVADQLGATTSAAIASAQDLASSALTAAQRQGTAFQRDLAELFERQPLALGAIGLCLGAVAAAAFPVTKAEQQTLGETSDAVKAEASTLLRDGVASARDAIGATQDAAAAQGLTRENAAQRGKEALDQAKALAEKGLEAVETQLKKV